VASPESGDDSISVKIFEDFLKNLEDNFYINIHELINIHISADGHPITYV